MSSRSINEVTSKDEGHLVQKKPLLAGRVAACCNTTQTTERQGIYGTDAKDKEAVLDESHFDYIIQERMIKGYNGDCMIYAKNLVGMKSCA